MTASVTLQSTFGTDLTNAGIATAEECKYTSQQSEESHHPPAQVFPITHKAAGDCVAVPRPALRPAPQAARPIVLSVEAAIGTGKSTLLRMLQERAPAALGGKRIAVVQEPVDAWRAVGGEHNLLDAFYADPARYAFSFQTHCVLSRIRAVTEALATLPPDVDIVVLERCWDSDRNTFAEMLHEQGKISAMEWELYKEWYAFACRNAPRIDGHVYLECRPETCMRRLQSRARDEEVGVTVDYQVALIAKHEEWLRSVESEGSWLAEAEEEEELHRHHRRRGVCRLSADREFLSDVAYGDEVVGRILEFAAGLSE